MFCFQCVCGAHLEREEVVGECHECSRPFLILWGCEPLQLQAPVKEQPREKVTEIRRAS
jgi:hypothetical protein